MRRPPIPRPRVVAGHSLTSPARPRFLSVLGARARAPRVVTFLDGCASASGPSALPAPEKIKKNAVRRSCVFFLHGAEAWAGRRRGRMWTPHALWCVRIPGWGLRDLYSSPGRPHGWMEYSAALLLQIRIVSLRFLGLFVSGGGRNRPCSVYMIEFFL